MPYKGVSEQFGPKIIYHANKRTMSMFQEIRTWKAIAGWYQLFIIYDARINRYTDFETRSCCVHSCNIHVHRYLMRAGDWNVLNINQFLELTMVLLPGVTY